MPEFGDTVVTVGKGNELWAWVIVTVFGDSEAPVAEMVMVATLELKVVFAATVTFGVPLPVPDAGLIVTHD
jgi:hypothetical protein